MARLLQHEMGMHAVAPDDGAKTSLVLVATDLSAESDEAVVQGAALAERRGGRLQVCHVVPHVDAIAPLFPHERGTLADPALGLRAADALADQLARLRVEAEQLVLHGAPTEVLLDHVRSARPDVLVVAVTGKSAVEKWLLGSTTEKLVAAAPSQVYVARRGPSAGPVLAVTWGAPRRERALAAASDEARIRGAELVVVHGLDRALALEQSLDAPTAHPSDAASEAAAAKVALRAELSALGAEARIVVDERAPLDAALRLAEGTKPVLLVVDRRSAELAHDLSAQAPCSVLLH